MGKELEYNGKKYEPLTFAEAKAHYIKRKGKVAIIDMEYHGGEQGQYITVPAIFKKKGAE